MENRFLFYSHDGLGLGHVRRNLAIAGALAELDPAASILLATSADEVEELGVPEHADILKLPGLRKVANGDYASRRLPMSSKDVRTVRATLLEAAVDAFRPTVALVDKHPLGIGGELRRALAALRDGGGRAALGLRDILDEPATVLHEWAEHETAAAIAAYDRVLVYGIPSVFNTVREYRLPPELARRARYCGYVFNAKLDACALDARPPPPRTGEPVVLATAGGGQDGFSLLRTFVDAARDSSWQAIVVSGRQSSSSERETLRRLAGEAGVAFQTFVPALGSWFPAVDALVCMGGYNTLVEAAAAGVPTVCVPRTSPRQEQLLRASAFARLDLLRLIRPEQLDPLVLRLEVSAALDTPRPALARRAQTSLDLNGAAAAARQLLDLAGSPEQAAQPALVIL